MLRGAATCFYGYIGSMDVISSTGSATEQPTRSIPIAMVSATLITLFVYIATCLLVSLTTPTNLVSSSTALVNIFDYHQMDFIKSIAACGAISSLTVAMFGSMVSLFQIKKLSIDYEIIIIYSFSSFFLSLVSYAKSSRRNVTRWTTSEKAS